MFKVVSKLVLRAGASILLALPLAAGAAPAPSVVRAMAGVWQGQFQGMGIQLVVKPDGSFSEQEFAGGYMTMQTGRVRDIGKGMVIFIVEDWEPKSMSQYHPTGTVGGYTTEVPIRKPPGGTWRITFNGPNQFTMQDVNMGGVEMMYRVH